MPPELPSITNKPVTPASWVEQHQKYPILPPQTSCTAKYPSAFGAQMHRVWVIVDEACFVAFQSSDLLHVVERVAYPLTSEARQHGVPRIERWSAIKWIPAQGAPQRSPHPFFYLRFIFWGLARVPKVPSRIASSWTRRMRDWRSFESKVWEHAPGTYWCTTVRFLVLRPQTKQK